MSVEVNNRLKALKCNSLPHGSQCAPLVDEHTPERDKVGWEYLYLSLVVSYDAPSIVVLDRPTAPMEAPSTGDNMHRRQQDLIIDDPPTTLKRSRSASNSSIRKEKASNEQDQELGRVEKDEDEDHNVSQMRREVIYQRLRPFILGGLAALILGWWISSTILEATRHRWYVHVIRIY